MSAITDMFGKYSISLDGEKIYKRDNETGEETLTGFAIYKAKRGFNIFENGKFICHRPTKQIAQSAICFTINKESVQ